VDAAEMSTYKPTAAMARNAALALKVRQSKPSSQRGMTSVGLARASQLIRRDPLSLETVKRIKAYFDRHVVDKHGSTWSDRGKGWQAWMGWGGDEGWAWAKKIVAGEPRENPTETGTEEDYRGEHEAPDPEGGAPLHAVESMMPDYYTHPHYYFTHTDGDYDASAVIQGARDKPWRYIYVYRAVPKSVREIQPGNWVTTVRSYARDHIRNALRGQGKVIKRKVRAAELFTDGNSHFEWGWHPASPEQVREYEALRRATPAYQAARAREREAREVEEVRKNPHVGEEHPDFFVADKPVFHGTSETFSRFSLKKSTQGIIWFTSDKASIEEGESGAQGIEQILELKVDLRNPAGWKEYDNLGLGELRQRGYDGAILPRGDDGHFDGFVFDPKQIKIIRREKTTRKNPVVGKHRDLFGSEDTDVLMPWRDVPEDVMETLTAADFSPEELTEIEEEDEALYERLVRNLVKAANVAFPKAGRFVDGREVGDEVDNTDSISASLEDYRVLKGVREVPLGLFSSTPYVSEDDARRVRRLVAAIENSKEITPLIVVVDIEGGIESPYVLEGGHRLSALHVLRAKAFPALVVINLTP